MTFTKIKEKKKRGLYIGGYPIKDYLPILFFFSIIGAICVILSAIEKPNLWIEGSVIYLLLLFFLDHYGNTSDIQYKDHEIAELKQEIRKLESIRESDKHIIELLEKELGKAKESSQDSKTALFEGSDAYEK